MSESHLEDQLLDKLQDFLLELGHGFCFEARQKRILIGDAHNFVDLVFYHRVLKSQVSALSPLSPQVSGFSPQPSDVSALKSQVSSFSPKAVLRFQVSALIPRF